MARRADKDAAVSRPAGRSVRRASGDRPPTHRFTRIVILAALVLLAVYTMLAIPRLYGPPQSPAAQLVWLLIPLAVAFALGLLLIVESRRVERRRRPTPTPSNASAWRWRRRAAASGSGTSPPTRSSCPT